MTTHFNVQRFKSKRRLQEEAEEEEINRFIRNERRVNQNVVAALHSAREMMASCKEEIMKVVDKFGELNPRL
jgi:hypothetical protein